MPNIIGRRSADFCEAGQKEARKSPCRAPVRPAGTRRLHGMRGLVPAERAGEIGLDLPLCVAAILLAELYADARGALALRTLGSHPDYASRDRQLLVLAHQVE